MFPSNYVEPVTKGALKDSADSRTLADSNASSASDSSPDISSLPKYKVSSLVIRFYLESD